MFATDPRTATADPPTLAAATPRGVTLSVVQTQNPAHFQLETRLEGPSRWVTHLGVRQQGRLRVHLPRRATAVEEGSQAVVRTLLCELHRL
jgi:hypothetical protein